jgi:transcriptional regulator with XRE-family HTH domain
MNLGNTIATIRKKKGLKQFELAQLCKITQSYLSNIEKGNKEPHLSILKEISKALGVPLPVIFFISMTEEDVSIDKKELFSFLSTNFTPVIQNNFID